MVGLLLRLARHWIAGETKEEAVARAQQRNQLGIRGIINLLGEQVTEAAQIDTAVAEYRAILESVHQLGVQSTISVKPTQLGLVVRPDLFQANLRQLAEKARELNNFVWIDMEDARYTQSSIDIYLGLREEFDNLGLCIQAYLHRSEADLMRLLQAGGKIRLCKGAYNESPAIAIKRRADATTNFGRLMRRLFEHGRSFGIATHDGKLIDEARRLAAEHSTRFEFQMLLGVRDQLKQELAAAGFTVSEYIPYGRNWLPYSIRRLRERKRNVLLLVRSLISG